MVEYTHKRGYSIQGNNHLHVTSTTIIQKYFLEPNVNGKPKFGGRGH
jgi:hypothetical protein